MIYKKMSSAEFEAEFLFNNCESFSREAILKLYEIYDDDEVKMEFKLSFFTNNWYETEANHIGSSFANQEINNFFRLDGGTILIKRLRN